MRKREVSSEVVTEALSESPLAELLNRPLRVLDRPKAKKPKAKKPKAEGPRAAEPAFALGPREVLAARNRGWRSWDDVRPPCPVCGGLYCLSWAR